MIWKTTILLSLALCVLGDGRHAISEQRIKIHHKDHHVEHKPLHKHHGELSHIGSKTPEHHEEYAWSYPSYEFSYKVHDPHTHDFKGQHESREGDDVKGEYWLVQPDGRKRTVSYHADKHSGFHADVHFSDDHHHEEHRHEEHHHNEPKKEEEEGGEENAGVEEGGEGNEEAVQEENTEQENNEEEGGRGAEESRGRKEEVGRWIHDRFWGHSDGLSDYGRRINKHRDHDEYPLDRHLRLRDDRQHRRQEPHKDLGIIRVLGNYGRRDDHERNEWRGLGRRDNRERAEWHGHDDRRYRDEGREESRGLPERREYEELRSYPVHKSGSIVRENYVHPRFYRHSEAQRKRVTQ